VRVRTGVKCSHIDLESVLHEQPGRFGGSPLAGSIRIETQYDFRRKPVQLLDLLWCERGPARRDDRKAGLVHLAEVEIPLHEDPKTFLTYCGLTEIQAVECPAFRVGGGLGCVQGLR